VDPARLVAAVILALEVGSIAAMARQTPPNVRCG